MSPGSGETQHQQCKSRPVWLCIVVAIDVPPQMLKFDILLCCDLENKAKVTKTKIKP